MYGNLCWGLRRIDLNHISVLPPFIMNKAAEFKMNFVLKSDLQWEHFKMSKKNLTIHTQVLIKQNKLPWIKHSKVYEKFCLNEICMSIFVRRFKPSLHHILHLCNPRQTLAQSFQLPCKFLPHLSPWFKEASFGLLALKNYLQALTQRRILSVSFSLHRKLVRANKKETERNKSMGSDSVCLKHIRPGNFIPIQTGQFDKDKHSLGSNGEFFLNFYLFHAVRTKSYN